MSTPVEIEALLVRLTGDGSEYQRMLQEGVKHTEAAAKQVESAAKRIEDFQKGLEGFAGTALKALAIFGVAQTLGQAFEKFENMEKGQISLNAAIKANGHELEETIKDYVKFGKAIA